MRITRRQTTVGGRRLSYLAASRDTPGTDRRAAPDGARAVVFLHAFPVHAGMWAPQLEAIPEGWMALAPDVRGFGLSDPDPAPRAQDASLDDVAADVIALLDDVGVERAVFCGLSMGGYTLLALWRQHAARVSGMVLADTRATGDSEAGRAGRAAMLDLLDREGPAAVTAQMAPKLIGDTTMRERPAVAREVARLMSAASAEAIGYAVVGMMRRPDSTPLLAGVRCPTLVVVGDEDGLTPLPEAHALHEGIPGAALAIIPGAGHLSNLERPDAFNAALRWFLGAMPAPA